MSCHDCYTLGSPGQWGGVTIALPSNQQPLPFTALEEGQKAFKGWREIRVGSCWPYNGVGVFPAPSITTSTYTSDM